MQPTDVVGIELIDAEKSSDRGTTKGPSSKRSENGELALVNVINQHTIELIRACTKLNPH